MNNATRLAFRGKFLAIVIGLCLSLSVASAFAIHTYIKKVGQELVSAWLETEAISIQEGNFVVGISRFSRALFSSNIITTINIFQIRQGSLEKISSYGNLDHDFKICRLPELNKIVECYESIFHEAILYRSSFRPDLIAAFDLNPQVAIFLFIIVTSVLSGISLGFMLVMRRIIKEEHKRRLFLVKLAIDDLVSGSTPDPILFLELPEVAKNWLELSNHINVIKSELEESTRDATIGKIISQLSHDLRAPLHGFERLLHLPAEATVASHAKTIKESLHRLNSMIESLRYSDLASMIVTKSCILDFSSAFQDLNSKADSKGIVIDLQIDPIVDKVLIDSIKFERAWVNLASNAIDAAKSWVQIKVEANNSDLRVKVIDDGPGVALDFLPKLFLRGATHGKASGTGLGLAYVKQIVQGHGGDVVYRRENDLTIFDCLIPHAIEKLSVYEGLETQMPEKQIEISHVSICFHRPVYAERVCELLVEIGNPCFIFKTYYSDSSAVLITNVEELSLRGLEGGMEIIEIKKDISETALVERLKTRLNLMN